jgi:hypothetical protein
MTAWLRGERNPAIFVDIYQSVIEFPIFLCAMTLKKCCELCVIPLVERTEASILLPFTGALRRSTALERCLPPGSTTACHRCYDLGMRRDGGLRRVTEELWHANVDQK